MAQSTSEIPSLLDLLLDEQQDLTAVERFNQSHQTNGKPVGQKYYRDLLPASPPSEGEQYAFEVDLDVCSGCKSCVAACHSQNGLEENELWRKVGQMVGGTTELPVIQHVTTACHHCIEPACLSGCPVEAYVKDDKTGIVRHLDDQCIGCQYCILKCPYDVPVYSPSKGIVRKCDMCQDRLSAGEAPACVQSCPNRAIRISIVHQEAVVEESEATHFLPGAPDRHLTIPTTTYKSNQQTPNLLPADYFSVSKTHGHLPLVMMLVLTQMSVGAFFVEQLAFSYFTIFDEQAAAIIRPSHLVAALVLGLLGLFASVFHLGRPLYAYRAMLGLRTSWLSREILAFGIFAAAATIYVGAVSLSRFGIEINKPTEVAMGWAAALTGLLAVFCSIMIYVDTRRPCWTLPLTTAKFSFTGLILGLPTALFVSVSAAAVSTELPIEAVMSDFGYSVCKVLLVSVVLKLMLEAGQLLHLRERHHSAQKRSAMLLVGELNRITLKRYFFAILGGVFLPMILLANSKLSSTDSFHPLFFVVATMLVFVLLFIGELHERYLFFAASVAPKMPGTPAK